MRYWTAFVVLGVVVWMAGCHMGEVQVPRSDDPNSQMVWHKKLDCELYDQKTNSLKLSFDVKALGGMVSAGPGIGVSRTVGTKWNDNVQKVNAIYKEVCGRFNTGLLSVQRLQEKLNKIDDLYAMLEESKFRDEIGEYWNKQAQMALAELDAELQKQQQREAEQLSTKFDTFDTAFQTKLGEAQK